MPVVNEFQAGKRSAIKGTVGKVAANIISEDEEEEKRGGQ
jgi:hypothetical protein